MVRAIIFDCFGVLATDVWLAFCDSLPPEADKETAHDLNKAFDKGMISQAEFEKGVLAATGSMPPNIEQLNAGMLAKNTALLAYIAELKQNYSIGLLSNISSDWITRELLVEDEALLFDSMIFSYEVGMLKPDPRIYMLACERLRVGPHEAVMIDDREAYVTAAKEEGLKGIVYKDLPQLKQDLQAILGSE